MQNTSEKPFGYYAPSGSIHFLQALTKLGVSRGGIRKWVSKQWRKRGFEIVDATVNGVKFRLHIQSNTTDGKVLTSSQFYDKPEIEFLAQGIAGATRQETKRDSVFVDVGANTGYYSLNLFHLGYSRVIAIEPNPPTLDILRFNIHCNAFDAGITVVPVCIGNGDEVPFYASGGLGSASVIPSSPDSKPILVPSMPLSDILKEQGVTTVDGLKIDVEGFEDKALVPFFESSPRELWPQRMVIEDCHQTVWEEDILEHLFKIGYVKAGNTRGNQLLRLEGAL